MHPAHPVQAQCHLVKQSLINKGLIRSKKLLLFMANVDNFQFNGDVWFPCPYRNFHLKIKFIQRLYYSGKFQMFYQKTAVMGALVLKSGIFRFYAPPNMP